MSKKDCKNCRYWILEKHRPNFAVPCSDYNFCYEYSSWRPIERTSDQTCKTCSKWKVREKYPDVGECTDNLYPSKEYSTGKNDYCHRWISIDLVNQKEEEMTEKFCKNCIYWNSDPVTVESSIDNCKRITSPFRMDEKDFCSKWVRKGEVLDFYGPYESKWNKLKIWLLCFVSPKGEFINHHYRDVFRRMRELEAEDSEDNIKRK